jgi:hypothetical protein
MSDATATDNSTTEEPERGYVVDPNYTPRPTDRVGSFRNDTVGQNHGIKGLAGAFGVADRRSLLTAAKALDPEDHSVSESHVNVYPADVLGERNREGVKERIGAKLEEIKDVLTDEDHLVVQEVRGFFSKGEDGEAGAEVPQPAGSSPAPNETSGEGSTIDATTGESASESGEAGDLGPSPLV